MALTDDSGMDELYLTDMNGKVLFAGDPELRDKSLKDESYFGEENWKLLTAEGSWEDELLGVTVSKNGKELRYYAVGITGKSGKIEFILIGGEKTELANTIVEYMTDLQIRFSNITGYDEISTFAVNADTGKVVYASSELGWMIGKDAAEEVSVDVAAVTEGTVHRIRLNGEDRLLTVRKFESQRVGNWIFGTVSTEQSAAMENFYQWTALILFAMIFFAFISIQFHQGTGRKKMLRKFSVVLPASLLGTFVFLFYVYSMSCTSLAMNQMKVNAVTFAEAYESNRSLTSAVEEFYKDRYVDILKSSAEYVEDHCDVVMDEEVSSQVNIYRSRDEKGNVTAVTDILGNPLRSMSENHLLQAIAEDMGQERLMLFNSSGRTISSSDSRWYYEIQGSDDELKDGLLEVLDRKESFFYRIKESSKTGSENEMISCFAVPVRIFLMEGEDGNTVYLTRQEFEEYRAAGDKNVKQENGLLYAEAKTPKLIYLSNKAIAENTLNSMSPAQNSRLALLEDETGTYICSTDNLNGKELPGLGFDEADFGKQSYRYDQLNNERVFAGLVPIGTYGEYTLLTMFPCSDVFFGRVPVCLTGTACVLIVLFLMILSLIKNEAAEENAEEVEKKLILPQNARKYRNIREFFTRQEAEERIFGFARFILLIIIVYLLVRLANRTEINSGCLAFHYTIGKTWKREFSLFSMSYALYICIITVTLISVFRKLVYYFLPILGSTSETVMRLFLSLAEYICVIVLIFYNLYLFGVQMGTVLTSAGIMTIVVGLGANSLISDVIAGLFIIMEQEFKTGDIVTIDGFTGFVRNVGLRTTKVQDFSGSIKTFSNAKINGVLNLTDNYTTFFVTMNINVSTPVEKIEELVEKDLKKRLEGNEDLVQGPWFSGIPEVKGNVYVISIGATSLQQKAWSLRKDIIQEMLKILKENGILMS